MTHQRLLLKTILAKLAQWAIKKHDIEMVVVLGVNGTNIIKEEAYTVLSSRHRVRRVVNKAWWDFSIPLSILGYKDRKRSLPRWIALIAKTCLYLVFGPKNPHTLIMNLSYSHPDTMKFWSRFINPDILILSNFNHKESNISLFIDNTIAKEGKIILNEKSLEFMNKEQQAYQNIYLVGQSDRAFLKSIVTKETIRLAHGKSAETISRKSLSLVPVEALEFGVALGLLKEINLAESIYSGLRLDMPSILARINHNLRKSE
jgi:hypothetical protein